MKNPLFVISACMCICSYAVASTLEVAESKLLKGQNAIQSQQFGRGIVYCKEGIEVLGESYYSTNLVDDTGQKLVLAKIKEKEKDSSSSSSIYCKVLESRISAFKSKSRTPSEHHAKDL